MIGDEFIPLLNKAGGAGFQVTAYMQTWSDVEARIGSPAKAGQIAGNFNTLIILLVKEVAIAKLLTDHLPVVHAIRRKLRAKASAVNVTLGLQGGSQKGALLRPRLALFSGELVAAVDAADFAADDMIKAALSDVLWDTERLH